MGIISDEVRKKAFHWETVDLADEKGKVEFAVEAGEDTEDFEQTVLLHIDDRIYQFTAMTALRLLTGLAAALAAQTLGDNETP